MLKKQQITEKNLSRRERQIMDIIYRLGEAAAAQVLENLSSPPSYSAVRALLRVLEEKGHLTHRLDGPRYIFLPTIPPDEARKKALRHLMKTFFDDSAQRVLAALLDMSENNLSEEEFRSLSALIEKSRKEGK